MADTYKEYEKTEWRNNLPPDLDADHLNKIEKGIADASKEIVKVNSDLLNLTYNYDGTKGKTVYEVGTAFTGGTSNTVRTSKITFKTKFTSPPRILITDITSDPSLQRSSVMDAGIFGFTLCTKRTDTERADVFWVAVGT